MKTIEISETKFSRVYTDLRYRIETGRMMKGATFPSIQRLRETYQIGFRTAHEVTDRLRKEGYIEIEPRKAPVVCWQGETGAQPLEHTAVQNALAHRTAIMELHDTSAILLPWMLSFCAGIVDLSAAPSYEKARKAVHRGFRLEDWRLLSSLCQEIFKLAGNPLLVNVHFVMLRYSNMYTFLEELGTPLSNQLQYAEPFLSMLTEPDPHLRREKLTVNFTRIAQTIRKSIEQLEAAHGDALPDEDEEVFLWTTPYSKDPAYMRIALDMVSKIHAGVYPVNEYLPPEHKLAEEYGVVVATLRRSLAELRKLGYCRTYNVKGTLVIQRDMNCAKQTLSEPFYRRAALRQMYALQFQALIIYPVALRVAPHLTKEDFETIRQRLQEPNSLILSCIMDQLIPHLDLTPMRKFVEETELRVRFWHCYAFLDGKAKQLKRIDQKVERALTQLEDGDFKGFARTLALCYQDKLRFVLNHLVHDFHLYEASLLAIPEI